MQLEAESGKRRMTTYASDVSHASGAGGTELAATSSVEGVLAMVREQGGRVTSARRLVLEAIFAADGHKTAEELATTVQAQAPDVHMSTIYRNLDDMERLGVVTHAHLAHGPAVYHLAATAHGHLVCENCGNVIEAPDELFGDLGRRALTRFGFEINPRHFALLGRCQLCR